MLRTLTICLIWAFTTNAVAQEASSTKSIERLAIEKLEFLVGNWAGEGVSYANNGSESEYYDTEDVWFDLQNSLLIIQARGFRDNKQFYGLHTVIYFDKEKQKYVYNPYSSSGLSRSFYCDLKAKKLLCYLEDQSYRLTFQRTADGKWNEFGERLTDGAWQKNFETILAPVISVK
jgi:hypothetical protein